MAPPPRGPRLPRPPPRSTARPIVTQPDVGGVWPRPRPRPPRARPGSPFAGRAAGGPRLSLLQQLVRGHLGAPAARRAGRAAALRTPRFSPASPLLPARLPRASPFGGRGASPDVQRFYTNPAAWARRPKVQLRYRSRGPGWLESPDLGLVTLDLPSAQSPGSGPSRILGPRADAPPQVSCLPVPIAVVTLPLRNPSLTLPSNATVYYCLSFNIYFLFSQPP